MGCNCGGKAGTRYKVQRPDGSTYGPVDSKAAALAEISRLGGKGTIVPVSA